MKLGWSNSERNRGRGGKGKRSGRTSSEVPSNFSAVVDRLTAVCSEVDRLGLNTYVCVHCSGTVHTALQFSLLAVNKPLRSRTAAGMSIVVIRHMDACAVVTKDGRRQSLGGLYCSRGVHLPNSNDATLPPPLPLLAGVRGYNPRKFFWN